MVGEIPEAITKERVVNPAGSIDFSIRISYLVDGLFPDHNRLASVVGLGMTMLLEPIRGGRIAVPEEIDDDRFEFWLAGLAVQNMVDRVRVNPHGSEVLSRA